MCESLAERVPVVLMVYANLVLASGAERFVERAAAAGAAGLIVPDLPHDEAPLLREACDAGGLALVPLVAPTTPEERAREIGADARGFVYTVAVTGTTGERDELAPGLADTVSRARASSELPVAVGFGISTAAQAARVGGDSRRGDRGQPHRAGGRRGRRRGGWRGRARAGRRAIVAPMIVLVALTVGLVFWIVAWAFGVKSFDAFMVAALLTVTAAGIRIVTPFVNQMLGREQPAPDQR